MKVSFQDCNRELLARTNGKGRFEYQKWRNRPDTMPEVVPFVEGFVHSHLFSISLSDFEQVVRESEHALGNVQSSEQIKAIEDFTCPFAFQHLFHDYLETNKRLPTWQDLSAWLKNEAYDKYVKFIIKEFGSVIERPKLARAVRWRLGKFYYSTMREIELLTRLREEFNLPLRYHLLADVLLRVDFWIEDVLICVWFENPYYRSERGGRKPAAAEFFSGVTPPFKILNVKVERQGYGKFWRVSHASLESIARQILQAR